MSKRKIELNSCEESFVNGTNGCEAHPKCWIAALVQMNCERKAEAKLNGLGYETFLPVQKEVHQWSDRKKIIDRIVIPMVLFVRVAPKEYEVIRNLSFIHKLLALPGSKQIASPIPDEQIIRLKTLLEKAPSQVCFEPNIHKGDKVTVKIGALKGLEGYIIQECANSILVLEIELLGCVKLKIERSFCSW
ncbi:MAG: UpxY family transcription antiterminator [Clostridium sp.]|nr:UpxY family transcription antiterminator [Bacteroides sp.]MCM1197581.1 UpxY family transcription antiterminator [Clostridium sp.]